MINKRSLVISFIPFELREMKAEFGDGSMNVLQRDRIPKHLAVTLCNYSYSDTEKATVAKLEKTENKLSKKEK